MSLGIFFSIYMRASISKRFKLKFSFSFSIKCSAFLESATAFSKFALASKSLASDSSLFAAFSNGSWKLATTLWRLSYGFEASVKTFLHFCIDNFLIALKNFSHRFSLNTFQCFLLFADAFVLSETPPAC